MWRWKIPFFAVQLNSRGIFIVNLYEIVLSKSKPRDKFAALYFFHSSSSNPHLLSL